MIRQAMTLIIDDSPPGSWRAAIARREARATACAVCRQAVCDHPDAQYQSIAPPPAGDRK